MALQEQSPDDNAQRHCYTNVDSNLIKLTNTPVSGTLIAILITSFQVQMEKLTKEQVVTNKSKCIINSKIFSENRLL